MAVLPLILLLQTGPQGGVSCGHVLDRFVLQTDRQRAAEHSACRPLVEAYAGAMAGTPDSSNWKERDRLGRLLDAALQGDPDNPRLFIVYAGLRYDQGAWSDARRLLGRARARAGSMGRSLLPRERAYLAYLEGRIHQDEWRNWRSFGRLGGLSEGQWFCEAYMTELHAMTAGGGGAVASAAAEKPSPVDINVACPDLFERLMDQDFHLNATLKQGARDGMERAYREALEADPTFEPPWQDLVSELVFEESWEALADLGMRAAPVFPDAAWPVACRALAAYERDRLAEADSLFSVARARMTPDVRDVYELPDRVLSVSERRALAGQPEPVRRRVADAFWRSREVLHLTDRNERLLEHYARVTAADFLFGIRRLGLRGWDTDAGAAWIRYGRPLKIRDLAVRDGRASFWSYGPDPDLVFERFLTFARLRVHDHFRAQRDLMEEAVPQRFRPRFLDSVVPIDRQVVRLRRRDGTADLLVLAPLADAAGALEGAVTLLDAEFRSRGRWRDSALALPGVRVNLRRVPPGGYNLVIEQLDRGARVLHQARDTLSVSGRTGVLAASDLLLLRAVDAVGDERAVGGLRDLDVTYLYGTTIETGSPLGLYWEVYDPATDSAGTAHYTVTVEVRDVTGRSGLAHILRGIGRAFRSEAPAAEITYERSATPTGGAVAEWLTLQPDWQPGTHVVAIVIEDVLASRQIRLEREIRVTGR